MLQWVFRRLYHELAWCYDLVAALVSAGYWRHWIRAAVPFLQAGPVLELGCGTGYLQLALARTGMRHVGYDASRQMLRQANRRVRRAGYVPRLIRGQAERLPFPPAMFSDVVATFPAPYIVETATLAEVRRVLRPGGQLLIVDGGRLETGGTGEAAVNALFRATLQDRVEEHYGHLLRGSGFALDAARVSVGRSSILVLRARLV
ncbi:MAG TPA: class I SAM-dependent methyltransferase [Herpetosiphonaceae bacterium]|nr:class I SAM-dependent methyltransferase [Herpetosiphonaceae bacterium]